jgi:hypothetical protein
MHRTYPYAIENGRGERLTFTGVTRGPDGERLGVDGVAQPGAGPPMHVHYLQEEAARVVMPIAYVVGMVLGKYGKFKDAPPPIAADRARSSNVVDN